MIRAPLISVLAMVAPLAACSSHPHPPASVSSTPPPSAAPAAVLSDPFAALLDERATALLAAAAPSLTRLGPHPQRVATMIRVIWQTVASEPVSRIEAMAFLLPDGRLRWGIVGQTKDPHGIEVVSDLAFPKGVLEEGMGRSHVGACGLPLIPLVDAATLPEVAREDTFLHGYQRADACQVARDAAGAAWVASLDWFGVMLKDGDGALFVTAPTKVEGPTFTFGAPTATPMVKGARHPLVDGSGGPRCATGDDCFELGERAVLTGEHELALRSYGRACDLGHGLSCIHVASFDGDPAKADEHRRRAVSAFRTSCDGGDALDCAYLGIALETGQGVGKDEAAAALAYQRACNSDNALGCFNLGGLAREGRGLRKDPVAARAHYQHACDLGDQGGCDAAASLAP